MIGELYRTMAVDATPRRWFPALLWRGVLRAIATAEQAMADRNVPERHHALIRAQEIVGVLDQSFADAMMPAEAPAIHAAHQQTLRCLQSANLYNDALWLAQAREWASAMEQLWSEAARQAGPALEGRWQGC